MIKPASRTGGSSAFASGPVLFCGDPHGKFTHIVSSAIELDASAVVLLGDLQPLRPLHEELAQVPETFSLRDVVALQVPGLDAERHAALLQPA